METSDCVHVGHWITVFHIDDDLLIMEGDEQGF